MTWDLKSLDLTFHKKLTFGTSLDIPKGMSHSDPERIEKRAKNFGDPGHDPQHYLIKNDCHHFVHTLNGKNFQ